MTLLAMVYASDNAPEKADPPADIEGVSDGEAEGPGGSRKMGGHEHHSDKSVVCGGVIIGGLFIAAFAAVYCYIRVTRTRHAQTHTFK